MAAPSNDGKTPQNVDRNEHTDLQGDAQGNRKKAMFFGAVGMSILMGFGFTMYRIKRKDPIYFQKILKPTKDIPETGVSVASKALAYASVISVTAMGVLTWGTFKIMGVHNASEFHQKLLTYFPAKEQHGRTEFDSLRDLAEYLESEDRKTDMLKKKEKKS